MKLNLTQANLAVARHNRRIKAYHELLREARFDLLNAGNNTIDPDKARFRARRACRALTKAMRVAKLLGS